MIATPMAIPPPAQHGHGSHGHPPGQDRGGGRGAPAISVSRSQPTQEASPRGGMASRAGGLLRGLGSNRGGRSSPPRGGQSRSDGRSGGQQQYAPPAAQQQYGHQQYGHQQYGSPAGGQYDYDDEYDYPADERVAA